MLDPKEKAKELFTKFSANTVYYDDAKQCALIAIDEITNTIEYSSQADEMSKIIYWNKVKEEIEKL